MSDKMTKDDMPKKTQPGQREVVSGSPEHVTLLQAHPNATTYGPDVNVVPAPPPVSLEEQERRRQEQERNQQAEMAQTQQADKSKK
jgi:hypothetical protein